MSGYTAAVETARAYYNSEDADQFYFQIWGGEDIHVGLYERPDEPIRTASRRTVEQLAARANGLDANSLVIDFGSGFGGAARYLASTFGCRVKALNLSETENQRARAMNRDQGLDHLIEVIDGSFESVPAQDQCADLVWSQDAILHSSQREQVIAEAARVLRPGGDLIFTDPMQADDCPPGVLQPIFERIHLSSLGSIQFYRQTTAACGLVEVEVVALTQQLITHYTRVREELMRQRPQLIDTVSDAYIERMIAGLGHWIEGGRKGHLSWGILHFRAPLS